MGKAFGYPDSETDDAAEHVYDAIMTCKHLAIPVTKIVQALLGEVYSLSEEIEAGAIAQEHKQ